MKLPDAQRRPHWGLVGLLLAVACVLLAGCTATPPRPTNGVVDVARGMMAGVEWSVRAMRVSAEELNAPGIPESVCLPMTIDGVDAGRTCATAVDPPDAFLVAGLSGATTPGQRGPMLATGIVRHDVASVQMELVSGERVESRLSSLEALGVSARAFAAALPAAAPVAVFIALDEDGNELGRAVGPGDS